VFNRAALSRLILITAGAIINGLAVVVFLAPFEIAPAGVSGVAVILNASLGTSIGLVIILGNIPIQLLAARTLGGWRNVAWTIYATVLFSASIDVIPRLAEIAAVSDDVLLNAVFGGIIGGFGGGLVYRAGATLGGTSTLARILTARNGLPISTTYLYANLATVGLAGLVLGLEGALYAIVVLALEGAASDYVLEGPSVIRTATIITDHPAEVAEAILKRMGRGVTGWQATGMYTGSTRYMLFVTVARFQIEELRDCVTGIDPGAFIVVGQGHVAYGRGFIPPPLQRKPGDA
jgi:uncharacterized membrane-anchored protein YitT (DUF2179 family)